MTGTAGILVAYSQVRVRACDRYNRYHRRLLAGRQTRHSLRSLVLIHADRLDIFSGATSHLHPVYSINLQIEIKNFQYTVASKLPKISMKMTKMSPAFGDFKEGGFNNGEVRPTHS